MTKKVTALLLAVFLSIVVFGFALVVVPALAQNAVPSTAREVAKLPPYASRLAHPDTSHDGRKSPASASSCRRPASPQDQVIYENGPVNGTTDAWDINFGYVVSDSFVNNGDTVTGFDIWVWEFPGDLLSSVDWSITSGPNGGTTYGSGTASGNNVSDQFISTNQFGYNIDKISISGLNVATGSGTVYLNLQNAVIPSGDPVFWDENSGKGCNSPGCPSQAYESAVGTIPSEAFDVVGNGNQGSPCFWSGNGLQILYSFSGKEDGAEPTGVVIDKTGNLYGTTQSADGGAGTAFRLAQKNLSWTFDLLYSFLGGANGDGSYGVTLGRSGELYGSGYAGGIQNCRRGYCGLIFSLLPSPTACRTSMCSWVENPVYAATGESDAWGAQGLVADQAGNLYGVSPSGGLNGSGAVFELTPSSGGWTESILYSFTGGSDGGTPNGVLVGNDGNLYGTTKWGGTSGSGTVYQLTPSADTWAETVIYSFREDPYYPYPPLPHSLVQDNSGNLFGESSYGKPEGDFYSMLFKLSPSNGTWVFTELWHGDESHDYDNFNNLAIDAAGNLYGTGTGGDGCAGPLNVFGYVFEVVDGNAFYLSFFDNQQFYSSGPLALDASGNLYGVTQNCGSYGKGTIWERPR